VASTKSISTLIVSKTYGNVFFDAVFNTDHSAHMTLTQHPVQAGAAITDHAYPEPEEVVMEIGMSDAALVVGASAQSRSVVAYQGLLLLMEKREPFTLITRLRTYENMMITSISAPDDYTTMNALRATIIMQKINIVTLSTLRIQQTVSSSKAPVYDTGESSGVGDSSGSSSSKPSKTSTTTTTTKTTTSSSNTSILKNISKKLSK
jgi:hypothetical protein